MKIDLEKMNRGQLMELRDKVDTAMETLAERELEAARTAAEEAAAKHGFTLAELGVTAGKNGRKRGAKSAPKNPPKYRNPDNPAQTWSGRGRRPDWIKAAGEDLSAFEI
ncbi:MAG: H-NS histone family protein [Pseudomonadota bacterium]